MKIPDDFEIEKIEGRLLIGRPQRAMLWMRDKDEMNIAVDKLAGTLEKHDDGETLWELYLCLIRHDGKWAEQLIVIDPDKRGLDESVSDFVWEQVFDAAYRISKCNAANPSAAG